MQATYRPGWTIEGRLVPGVDEDEATMAVEAARLLFRRGALEPGRVQRIVASSQTGDHWLPTFQQAMGLHDVGANVVEPGEFRRRRLEAADEGTLWLESHAPRPIVGETRPASAVASFGEDAREWVRDAPVREADASTRDKLVRWERSAPAMVSMGAYVPRASWERTQEARYRLLASTCVRCGDAHHPPVTACVRCQGPTKTGALPYDASVYAFTIIAAGGGPSEFEPLQDVEGSYGVIVALFEGGARVPGLVTQTALSELRVGLKVEPVFRRLYAQDGAWRYGTKFRKGP